MLKLMNSAMMPVDGNFDCRSISEKDFKTILNKANPDKMECYIGYQDTVDYVNSLSDKKFKISRKQTSLEDGDVMLVCRLKYRVEDPDSKGKTKVDSNDFEFKYVAYRKYNYEV